MSDKAYDRLAVLWVVMTVAVGFALLLQWIAA
jgi:hypothetical protein